MKGVGSNSSSNSIIKTGSAGNSGHNLVLQLFNLHNRHIIVVEADLVCVFSAELNWRLVNHFSLYDYVQHPTSIGTIAFRASKDTAATATLSSSQPTPSKKAKLENIRTAAASIELNSNNDEQSFENNNVKTFLCVGNQLGAIVLVPFLSVQNSVNDFSYWKIETRKDSKNCSAITCFASNERFVYFGHENGSVGFINLSDNRSVAKTNKKGQENEENSVKDCGFKSQYWKCHDTSISCMTLSKCSKFLFTCSLALELFLWDRVSKTLLNKVKPFSTPIKNLLFVAHHPSSSASSDIHKQSPQAAATQSSISTSIVIAASENNNYLMGWNCNSLANNSLSSSATATTNFHLSSSSRLICSSADVGSLPSNNYSTPPLHGPHYISSCNVDGSLQFFSLNVNGKISKSSFNIRVVDSKEKHVIPIIGCCFFTKSALFFYGAYPNYVQSEQLSFKDLQHQNEIVLERNDPRKLSVKKAKAVASSTPVAINRKDAKKSLISSTTCHSMDISSDKVDDVNGKEPNLIDLLERMSSNTNTGGVGGWGASTDAVSVKLKPRSKNMQTASRSQALLLMQSLSSNDNAKLNTILGNSNDSNLIRETIRNLKGPQAFMLTDYILSRKNDLPSHYVWLKEIVFVHFDYLQGCSKSLRPHFDKIRQLAMNESQLVNDVKSLKCKLELALLQQFRSSYDAQSSLFDSSSNGALIFEDGEEDEEGDDSALIDSSFHHQKHPPEGLSFYDISSRADVLDSRLASGKLLEVDVGVSISGDEEDEDDNHDSGQHSTNSSDSEDSLEVK